MRRLRWFIGLGFFAGILAVIIYYPLPSMLAWQSTLLKRTFFILFVCGSMCLFRICRGPTPADRAAALDIFGILIIGFSAILGIPTGRDWYIDIGIAWALQSFISILALGKYLEGRRFDE